jgi:hypothetical protein
LLSVNSHVRVSYSISPFISFTPSCRACLRRNILNMEIDSRRGVSIDEVLTVIKNGLTGST